MAPETVMVSDRSSPRTWSATSPTPAPASTRCAAPRPTWPRVPSGDDAVFSAAVTQVVTVAPAQVLAMVEIKAERNGRTLHNHAAFLARYDTDDRIAELWMVDALPATATSSGPERCRADAGN